jgi:hypothetical protein
MQKIAEKRKRRLAGFITIGCEESENMASQ